jgi:hypothetical protein
VIEAARPNLNAAEYRELEELATKYGNIFAIKSDDYGRIDRVYQRIHTGDAQTILQIMRRLPLAT